MTITTRVIIASLLLIGIGLYAYGQLGGNKLSFLPQAMTIRDGGEASSHDGRGSDEATPEEAHPVDEMEQKYYNIIEIYRKSVRKIYDRLFIYSGLIFFGTALFILALIWNSRVTAPSTVKYERSRIPLFLLSLCILATLAAGFVVWDSEVSPGARQFIYTEERLLDGIAAFRSAKSEQHQRELYTEHTLIEQSYNLNMRRVHDDLQLFRNVILVGVSLSALVSIAATVPIERKRGRMARIMSS